MQFFWLTLCHIALAVNLLIPASGHALPAIQKVITFYQADDGSSFTGKLIGDEHFSYIKNEEGHIIVKNEEGTYVYATIEEIEGKKQLLPSNIRVGAPIPTPAASAKGLASGISIGKIPTAELNQLWRNAAKQRTQRTPHSLEKLNLKKVHLPAPAPSAGPGAAAAPEFSSVPLLTVLIEFEDYKIQSPVNAWEDKIYGTSEGELNDYFDEISQGQFQIDRVNENQGVSDDGIITVSIDDDHPDPGQSDTHSLLVEALEIADEHIDFSEYDNDNNGTLSVSELQVTFIFAGGESAFGDDTGVWAHAWCIEDDLACSLPFDVPFTTCAPTLDGVEVASCNGNGYSRFGERHGNHDATIGVIAHELAHSIFNLPDLYDIDGGSYGIGDWGLMASGAWGEKPDDQYAGQTPVHMSAWSKLEIGFADSLTVANVEAQEFHKTTSSEYQVIKLITSRPSEYFLLENRHNDGYDRGISPAGGTFEGGLAIWHIDSTRPGNSDENHKLVDLEEANNETLDDSSGFAHVNHLFFNTNQSEFDNDTDPDSKLYYNSEASNVSVRNISAPGDVMTADIEEDRCRSIESGSLLRIATYDDSNCGDEDDDYVISSGHAVDWNGVDSPLTGSIEVENGGTFTVNGSEAATINGLVELSGGTLDIDEDLTIQTLSITENSNIDIADGKTLTVTNDLDIPTAETLSIAGGTIAGGLLDINGTLKITGGTQINNDINLEEGSLDINADTNVTGELETQLAVIFEQRSESGNPLNFDIGDFAIPGFVDLDGDQDLDAFIGNDAGDLKYFENTGSSGSPVFTAKDEELNPLKDTNIESAAAPRFTDIDNDGDVDAFIGAKDGTITYFENLGTRNSPDFVLRTGSNNPLNGVDVIRYSYLAFVDIDGDEDTDAFIGAEDGEVHYFENTGSLNEPVFTERAGSSNPLSDVDVDQYSAPAFIDVDNDGDFDAFIGGIDGDLTYYENKGTLESPDMQEVTGSDNPFHDVDMGNYSTPTFVDIDNDGDRDAFVGEGTGKIRYFIDEFDAVDMEIDIASGTALTLNQNLKLYAGNILNLNNSGTIHFNGDLDLTGELNTTNASVTFSGDLDLRGGTLSSSNGDLFITNGSEFFNGTLDFTGGRLLLPAGATTHFKQGMDSEFSNTDILSTNDGTQATITISNNVSFDINSGSIKDLNVSGSTLSAGRATDAGNNSDSVNFDAADLIVTISGNGSGTVSSSPAGINCGSECTESFDIDTSVTLSASPDAESTFTGWSGEGCSGTGTCVVTMDSLASVTATFTKRNFTLSVTSTGDGTGRIVSSPSGIDCTSCDFDYVSGTIITLAAIVNSGSSFEGWSGGGCSGTSNCAVTLTTDLTVTADFSDTTDDEFQLSLTHSGDGDGSIDVSPAGVSCGTRCWIYDTGTSVTLTATAADHSLFDSWSGHCSGSGTCTVTMDAAKSVDAAFNLRNYSIIASAGEGGSISPEGTTSVIHGTNQTFTITPNAGYLINLVERTEASITTVVELEEGNHYTFRDITTDATLSASFVRQTHTITATAHENGSIAPEGSVEVPSGDSQLFTITPDENYVISLVRVDGVDIEPVASYPFNDVTEDGHTIEAFFRLKEYTIETDITGEGSIGPVSATVSHGADQTFTITPAEHYHIESIRLDGVLQEISSTITLEDITADHTLSVVFELDSYEISVDSGENGTISPGTTDVLHGSSQTFVIRAADNYHISEVLVDGEAQALSGSNVGTFEMTFNNVGQTHTLSASFDINQYDITVISPDHGNISPGSSSVMHGDSLIFEFTPDDNYHVSDVLLDNISKGPLDRLSLLEVSSDHSLEARFEINSYLITTSASNGTISPSNPDVTHGEDQEFTIHANANHHLVDVVVNGESQGPVSSVAFSNVTEPHSIVAVIEIDTFLVATTAGSNGIIAPSNPEIGAGNQQVFSIIPNEGFEILEVSLNGVSQGRAEEITLTNVMETATIEAFFEVADYTISTSTGGNGAISPSIGTFQHGMDGTFTFIPDDHYHLQDIRVDDVSVGTMAEYTFSDIKGDHTLHAIFSLNHYTVTTEVEGSGDILPESPSLLYGSEQTFEILPDNNHKIKDVLLNGESLGVVSEFTITNVTGPQTLSAVFEIENYTISTIPESHGQILPGTLKVDHGESETFTIVPDTNYEVEEVFVDGISLGEITEYTFTNVSEGHEITASFRPVRYPIEMSVSDHGRIVPEETPNMENTLVSKKVSHGSNQTFLIIPDKGFHIEDVTIDGISQGSIDSYTFRNVREAHSISATFQENPIEFEGTRIVTNDDGSVTTEFQLNSDDDGQTNFTSTVTSDGTIRNMSEVISPTGESYTSVVDAADNAEVKVDSDGTLVASLEFNTEGNVRVNLKSSLEPSGKAQIHMAVKKPFEDSKTTVVNIPPNASITMNADGKTEATYVPSKKKNVQETTFEVDSKGITTQYVKLNDSDGNLQTTELVTPPGSKTQITPSGTIRTETPDLEIVSGEKVKVSTITNASGLLEPHLQVNVPGASSVKYMTLPMVQPGGRADITYDDDETGMLVIETPLKANQLRNRARTEDLNDLMARQLDKSVSLEREKREPEGYFVGHDLATGEFVYVFPEDNDTLIRIERDFENNYSEVQLRAGAADIKIGDIRDAMGFRETYSVTHEAVTQQLNEGLNLVSLPIDTRLEPGDLEVRFGDVKSILMWKDQKWHAYTPSQALQKIYQEQEIPEIRTDLVNGMGFWIDTEGEVTVTYSEPEEFDDDKEILKGFQNLQRDGWYLLGESVELDVSDIVHEFEHRDDEEDTGIPSFGFLGSPPSDSGPFLPQALPAFALMAFLLLLSWPYAVAKSKRKLVPAGIQLLVVGMVLGSLLVACSEIESLTQKKEDEKEELSDYTIHSIWKWESNENWSVYSPHDQVSNVLQQKLFPTLDKIPAGQGFWIRVSKREFLDTEELLWPPDVNSITDLAD